MYCTIQEVELTFGEISVTKWSDVNETGARNDEKILDAIAQADNDINEVLFEEYEVPFADMPDTPRTINKVSRLFTGYILYIMRGLRDTETDTRMDDVKQKGMEILDAYVNGRPMLDRNSQLIERRGLKVPIHSNDPRFDDQNRLSPCDSVRVHHCQ